MHPVERYLTELRILQDAGTPETAGYPAFKALIDEIGKNLKPKVLCLIHPEDLGAGTPDAAFFTAD
ncbi:MAG: DNA methyltransferase, partial [Gemmatimonadota bacterium]